MRIAVANWSRRRAGGAEEYLDRVLPALTGDSHALAFVCETYAPPALEPIRLPAETPVWSLSKSGAEALEALRQWKPDVVWVHALTSPAVEEAIQRVAPSVFFAHDYHGTCISGTKTHAFPAPTVCRRRFGTGCLIRFLPRRCGGLNPITMLSLYRREARRLGIVRSYRAIVALSQYIVDEYLRHGLDGRNIRCLPAPPPVGDDAAAGPPPGGPPSRLLFLGRMHRLKGGPLLLDALPLAARILGRPLHATFAGDGPDRSDWEAHARRFERRCSDVSTNFIGWIDRRSRADILAAHHALIVPSIWPEPFGLVGYEAGAVGLPSIAFAVGGIPEWLFDGVNGCLAPGDPPTAGGLAHAIVRCLEDEARYATLRRGAREEALKLSMKRHVGALVATFESVVS
jgi:glycosyltransferase involved in cell wall biosynthesis